MKKLYIVIIGIIFLGACSIADFRTGVDKGAKTYVMISDNQELIEVIYNQIEVAKKAMDVYQADKNPLTEKAVLEELFKLYNLSIEARVLLKDLGKMLKEE